MAARTIRNRKLWVVAFALALFALGAALTPGVQADEAVGTTALPTVGHTHETDAMTTSLIEGLMTGGTAFIYITLAAMLPLLWVMTLIVHLARPYVVRNLRKFTLRFGADVWWLLYVLLRDAVMILTFTVSAFFFYPNLLVSLALPVTGPLATVLLFWALAVKLTRRADESARDFRLVTWLVVAGATAYLVPFLLGIEAPMRGWERWRELASSVTNPGLAMAVLYASLVLFGLTGAYIFHFVMAHARREAGAERPAEARRQGMPPGAGPASAAASSGNS